MLPKAAELKIRGHKFISINGSRGKSAEF